MRWIARSALHCAFVCGLWAANASAQPPSDFTLEALTGSYSLYGENQLLFLDASGNVTFQRSDLDSASGDSIFVTIPSDSVSAIYDTVLAANFASLDTLYDAGEADGSGVFLEIGGNSTLHTVEAVNLAVPDVNRIIRTVNRILQPLGILLKYDALNDTLTN